MFGNLHSSVYDTVTKTRAMSETIQLVWTIDYTRKVRVYLFKSKFLVMAGDSEVLNAKKKKY